MQTTTPILEISNLSKHFGGVIALWQVNMEVRKGQIASLIGPNGAGKTTLFNCITGLETPTTGAISFEGRRIAGLRPNAITKVGMARTFQNIRLFPDLTALDNVKIGRHCRSTTRLWGAITRNKKQRREEAEITEKAREALAFVGLDRYSGQLAGNLSYGDQRRLEIARALATEPKLLLLDEPAAGMNPLETQRLMQVIHAIRARGLTVLLIEHDMKVVMRISDWVTVIDHGEKISNGQPEVVRQDERVIKAYLGKSYDA